jgi:hypothetical protein
VPGTQQSLTLGKISRISDSGLPPCYVRGTRKFFYLKTTLCRVPHNWHSAKFMFFLKINILPSARTWHSQFFFKK